MAKAKRSHPASYTAYLRSSHWQKRKRVAGDSAGWRCPCGARATDIHHRTYKNLGHEKAEDLHAICRTCHTAIHKLQASGYTLADATDYVLLAGAREKGLRVVKLPKIKRQKSKKKTKAKRKAAEARKPVNKKLRALANENDRLHAIQQRNREKREQRMAQEAPRVTYP